MALGIPLALETGMADFGQGLSKALANPNVQQMLAQTGAGLDPQGVGGALGGATSNMIQNQSQQQFMKQLLKMLGGGGKIKVGADGAMEMQTAQAKEGEGGEQSRLAGPSFDQSANSYTDEMAESWVDELLGGL